MLARPVAARRNRRSAFCCCSAASCDRSPTSEIALAANLRRPGGDRHRERAAVRPSSGAHARRPGGAGAANRHVRYPARHQSIADRRAARIRQHRRSPPRGCSAATWCLCFVATAPPSRAAAGATPEGPLTDVAAANLPIDPSANFPSRAILDKKMLHLPDWSLIELPEHELNIHEMFGLNSALFLPLLREGDCIGAAHAGGKTTQYFRRR